MAIRTATVTRMPARTPFEVFDSDDPRFRGLKLCAGWYWRPLEAPNGPAADEPQGPFQTAGAALEAASLLSAERLQGGKPMSGF